MISASEPQYVTETCFGRFRSDSPTCLAGCKLKPKCIEQTGIPLNFNVKWKRNGDGGIIIMRLAITLKPLPMSQNME